MNVLLKKRCYCFCLVNCYMFLSCHYFGRQIYRTITLSCLLLLFIVCHYINSKFSTALLFSSFHCFITKCPTKRLFKRVQNWKMLIFHVYFVNMDISLIITRISRICLKASTHTANNHLEGRVPQNSYIRLSSILC